MQPNHSFPAIPSFPIIIVGGGPVGLACAALLAKLGIETLVIEADEGYCTGSRAICVSRRSQDILGWAGADEALATQGLPWTGGRSYFRNIEVLHFTMAHDDSQRFAPMVNIAQFALEQLTHEAGGPKAQVWWGHSVTGVSADARGARLSVRRPDGSTAALRCDWLIACDGGRSTVREQLGLALEGMQYDGKYVIVDIKQATKRATERLAWFDPPSNPGSTILMHRQPGDVWRIDYQIADTEDPEQALNPDNVLPRVQAHLDMIGETAPWTPLWISLYNAKCLSLASYRHQRVLFAGDAAHMVPIFGVRGLNSGLDDAANLAWKLALVLRGQAPEHLMDSYSTERVAATKENLAYGAKSTEFMAPPHRGFELMRQAALRLALDNPTVRSLLNPRQSLPVVYVASALNFGPALGALQAGMVAPDAPVRLGQLEGFLSQQFGQHFSLLHFGNAGQGAALERSGLGVASVRVLDLPREHHALAWQRYGAAQGLCVLVRPDGYIMALWPALADVDLTLAMKPCTL